MLQEAAGHGMEEGSLVSNNNLRVTLGKKHDNVTKVMTLMFACVFEHSQCQ